jgi:hypothetical protein
MDCVKLAVPLHGADAEKVGVAANGRLAVKTEVPGGMRQTETGTPGSYVAVVPWELPELSEAPKADFASQTQPVAVSVVSDTAKMLKKVLPRNTQREKLRSRF